MATQPRCRVFAHSGDARSRKPLRGLSSSSIRVDDPLLSFPWLAGSATFKFFPKSAIGFWTAQSCGVDSGFQPRFVSHVGAVALPGRPIAILSIVFGIAEAFFARLPRQRLL